jgi:hypothetical protein
MEHWALISAKGSTRSSVNSSVAIVGLVDDHADAPPLLAPEVQVTLVAAFELGGDLGDDRGGLAMELRRRGVCRCDGAQRAQGLPITGICQALSFWALGAVLMGIGWFYQGLLFQRTAALRGET